jgi:predicted dienelactone hydrolase
MQMPDATAEPGNPSAKGAFSVTIKPSATVTRGNRSIPVVARIPSGATKAPLVVLLPGFQLKAAFYSVLAGHLASHGMVVVSADPPASLFSVSHAEMDLDASAVIDWALGSASGLNVDTARVAIMGHSLGGKISFMASARDARIKAVFGIDPVNGGGPAGYSADRPDIVPDKVSPLTIPIGLIGETTNTTGLMACAPSEQNYATFFEAAAASPSVIQWTVPGADHMDFVDDTSTCGFVCGACTAGTADPKKVTAATRTLAAAFFQKHFFGMASADAWLTGNQVPQGLVAKKR